MNSGSSFGPSSSQSNPPSALRGTRATCPTPLKWKMSRRCNTALCVSPSALDEEVPRLRGRQVAPADDRLDEEVGGWTNVRASDVPALLGKRQLEALGRLSAGSEVQWQRHDAA